MDFIGFIDYLNINHNINLSIFNDDFDRDIFINGLKYTAILSFLSIFLSLFIGLVGSYSQYLGNKWICKIVNLYVNIFRNTPPLIQLYFFYFALGPYITSFFDSSSPVLSNVTWAIISLSLYAGAFNIEVFRSGIDAVPKSTVEAADALGMSDKKIFRKIIFPLSFRISLPGLTNSLVNLIKTTTNAYAIAVPEVLYASSQIWSDQLNTLEMMFILLTFFILIISIFTFFMKLVERKLFVPGWGKQ